MSAELNIPSDVSPEAVFGAELRRLRHAEGWSLDGLGNRLGYSGTMIGYWERAKRPVPEEAVTAAEGVFGLKGELVALWKEINPKAPPRWFRQWPKIESAARLLRFWEPLLVPGILQTEQYARAVLRAEPGATKEKVEEALKSRLCRQSIFSRPNPPTVQFVIDEGVLHRSVEGAAVMHEQLTYLLTLMDKITIQVVPLSVGMNCGLLGGFAIAHVPGAPDAAYLETASNGQVTDRVEEVEAISLRYDTIRAWAHPVHVTRDLLKETIVRYEQ
ncbi:helix-turn-helix domain-containing protein [Nonomuraea sp. K274]|uniref:Helix-turn-helix domain-containing protein n=1 Tax=Nonomuraea cypriaca TaxID=1187855 RepID=A0A931EZX1_9ACTN|nr:helix-turn-helix transcriptional regulator [Nonomuraea cypriaca]MBF8185693.1 helix-turn-helix domain-containing protein [Nonomuraea cypriaca]